MTTMTILLDILAWLVINRTNVEPIGKDIRIMNVKYWHFQDLFVKIVIDHTNISVIFNVIRNTNVEKSQVSNVHIVRIKQDEKELLIHILQLNTNILIRNTCCVF